MTPGIVITGLGAVAVVMVHEGRWTLIRARDGTVTVRPPSTGPPSTRPADTAERDHIAEIRDLLTQADTNSCETEAHAVPA